MRVKFVEVGNFRRLRAARVDFSPQKTVFVGANNSGKTSAMEALRYFLLQKPFSMNDFTLSEWPAIDKIGSRRRIARGPSRSPRSVLPRTTRRHHATHLQRRKG